MKWTTNLAIYWPLLDALVSRLNTMQNNVLFRADTLLTKLGVVLASLGFFRISTIPDPNK